MGREPLSAEEFLKRLYGSLPSFFKSEEELRRLWSDSLSRKALLELKYQALSEATETLGSVEKIRATFLASQKALYAKRAA